MHGFGYIICMAYDVCPHCGAELPPRAKACPECGSDEKTGWSEDANVGSLGLPDEDFNYNEYIEREFGSKKNTPHGIKPFWRLVAILVLLAFGALVFAYLR